MELSGLWQWLTLGGRGEQLPQIISNSNGIFGVCSLKLFLGAYGFAINLLTEAVSFLCI